MSRVKLFRRQEKAGTVRGATGEDMTHLVNFARTRGGVEGFVEPSTQFSATTVVLVAADGEWTRRRVEGAAAAAQLGRRLGIPVYDATLVGYPQRMRDWTARQRRSGDTG